MTLKNFKIILIFITISTRLLISQESVQKNDLFSDEKLHFVYNTNHWAIYSEDIQVSDFIGNIDPFLKNKTRFINGLALVRNRRNWNSMGYIKPNGELLNGFDALGYAKEFNEGYASYRKESN